MNQEMKQEIEQGIYPFMKQLFYRIAREGDSMEMDGIWVYNEKAQFVGGKVINLCSFVVTELLTGEEAVEGKKLLSRIVDQAAGLPMKTWGIFNAVIGIYRLEQKGIRDQVISGETWELLKKTLDFRSFIDCGNHLALIDLPTNYYGVAFGIARYRELLGWEMESYSAKLLARFMEHIEAYSGEWGFMDETQGHGRFDRYSILVPAEITATVQNTGMELPGQIVRMLRKSADICLQMANDRGYGFSYGRSTGAYGDTGVMEVLSAAARVPGLLSQEEAELAYAYCTRVILRFKEFWIDSHMKSVNLWDNGRSTDLYRNKNRILSENLSLCMQVAAMAAWENPDKTGTVPGHAPGPDLNRQEEGPKGTLHVFARGDCDRGLAIVRDCGHVWSLPLICGGEKYYRKSAYLPIPYEQFLVTGVPEYEYANLVPVLTMADGTKLMPVAYMKHIELQQEPERVLVRYCQDRMCRLDGEEEAPYEGITSETVYQWTGGEIIRTDTFSLGSGLEAVKIGMEYLTFSSGPSQIEGGVRFSAGGVYEITAQGFESCDVTAAAEGPAYRTPDGALNYHVKWEGKAEGMCVTAGWRLKYHPA